jgi:hypothetical protein
MEQLTDPEKKLLTYIVALAEDMTYGCGDDIADLFKGEKIPEAWEEGNDRWWRQAITCLKKKLEDLGLTYS